MTAATLRRRLIFAGFALALAVSTVVLMATQRAAGAHHPQLTSNVQRPCGPQAPWSGTVTVSSDADYGKDWKNKHRIDGATFTAFGPLVDDQIDYVIAVPGIPAATPAVLVDTRSRWQNKDGDGGVVGPIPGSIILLRPAATDCPPPPTTTTTVPPTTTTLPPTDTTDTPAPPVIDTQVMVRQPDVYVGELPRTGTGTDVAASVGFGLLTAGLLLAAKSRRLRGDG